VTRLLLATNQLTLTPACRCEAALEASTVRKIAQNCQVDIKKVIAVHDMETIYQVPILLEEQGLLPLFKEALELDQLSLDPTLVQKGSSLWQKWKATVLHRDYHDTVSIALVGKYIEVRVSRAYIHPFDHMFGRSRESVECLLPRHEIGRLEAPGEKFRCRSIK
jgi:CTP synthase